MTIGIISSVLLTGFFIFIVFRLIRRNLLLRIGISFLASIPGTAMALYISGVSTDNMALVLSSFLAPAALFLTGATLSLIGALYHARNSQI